MSRAPSIFIICAFAAPLSVRSTTLTDLTSAFVYGGGADIRMGSGPVGLHVAADVFRLRDYGQGSGSWRMLVGITAPMR